jgi:hypothetical protein
MRHLYILAVFVFLSQFSFSQQQNSGNYGITLTVEQIMAQQQLLNDGKPKTPQIPREHELHLRKRKNPEAPEISSFPVIDNSMNHGGGNNSIAATQNIGSNFLGPVIAGWIPPDCNGAAGPTQILVVANGTIAVYSKTGVLGGLNVSTNTFFNSVRNASNTSDSHIRYDRLTQRWFVVAINTTATNNRIMIAVSSGPTIVNTTSFTFFFAQHNLIPPAGDANKFLDYPTLGVDANALYIGGVRFTATFDGTPVYVVQKSSILAAGPMVINAFRNAGAIATGIVVPQGVDNDDPAATQGYFVGTDAGVFSRLNFIRVNNPGSVTPTITNLTPLNVPANNYPILQVHLGQAAANRRLDGLDDRLFAAHVMKNKLTGVTTLWAAHTTVVNNTGVASGTMDRNAMRWYQIGNMTTATPTLIQSGTLFDNAAANPRGFWNGSIAMSGQGHAVSGFSTAGTNFRADAAVAGRYSADVAGSLQPFVSATASSTAYNAQMVDGQRWGDYSQVVVDPNDNMTMWTFQEYCNGNNSWGERVIQLIAPAPPPPASLNPLATVGITASVTVNIVASSTPNNTGFFDPGPDVGGPGFANHITASVTGGITVNSITFIDATHVNIDLNTSAAVPGTYVITITNPDGQITTINITVTGSPLPVELLSFTAQTIDKTVLLKWITASENNNYNFIVERSKDAVYFEDIGKVKGAGSTTTATHYIFSDEHPFNGISYYRLKQTDFNGEFVFSNVVSVKFGKETFSLVSAYADYENHTVNIFLNENAAEIVTYEFTDVFGKIISKGSQNVVEGVNKIVIDGKLLARGIYYVTVANGKSTFSTKILY